MKREPVESSNIVSVGFQDGLLEVEFKSGIYQYAAVPEELYRRLMAAESKGSYLRTHIARTFACTKIQTAEKESSHEAHPSNTDAPAVPVAHRPG